MTREQRNAWICYILSNDRAPKFNLYKDFSELDWYRVHKLEMYAELFRIKPRNGQSRAKTLWDRVHEDLPF